MFIVMELFIEIIEEEKTNRCLDMLVEYQINSSMNSDKFLHHAVHTILWLVNACINKNASLLKFIFPRRLLDNKILFPIRLPENKLLLTESLPGKNKLHPNIKRK